MRALLTDKDIFKNPAYRHWAQLHHESVRVLHLCAPSLGMALTDDLASLTNKDDITAQKAALAKLGGVGGIASKVGSDLDNGLSSDRVLQNAEQHGPNKVPEKPIRPFLSHLVEAFEDDTLRILVASAVVSLASIARRTVSSTGSRSRSKSISR